MPKKGGHDAEHENLEAWVIPYADLLTLLLAMFLALFATSNADLQKMKEFSKAFRSSSSGANKVVDPGVAKNSDGTSILDMGGAGLLDGTGLSFTQQQVVAGIEKAVKNAGTEALAREQAAKQAATTEANQLDAAKQQIESALKGTGLEGKLEFKQDSRGLHVTVLTDGVLFDSGSSKLQPQSDELINSLGAAMKNIDNEIEVVGHTDSVGTDSNNRILSTQRANSVAEELVARLGLPSDRILTSGAGASKPIADNSTAEGRAKNRRVEINILSKNNLNPVASAPTGDSASTGATNTAGATAPTIAGGAANG